MLLDSNSKEFRRKMRAMLLMMVFNIILIVATGSALAWYFIKHHS